MSEINNNEVENSVQFETKEDWKNAVPADIQKEAEENKEVLEYSDSVPDKFMNFVNEHRDGAEATCAVLDGIDAANGYSDQLEAAKEFSQPQAEIIQEAPENNSGDIKTQLEEIFPDVKFDI